MGIEPNFQSLPRGKATTSNNGLKRAPIPWEKEVLPKVKEVLRQFRQAGVYHPTLRAVYYKLFSLGVIPENSQAMYKGLQKMLTRIRMSMDDDEVQPDTFADESRESPYVDDVETLDDWIAGKIYTVKRIVNGESTFEPHRWTKQPKYVEVWTEKQAMYSTFASILRDHQVGIQSSKGFNSIPMLYEAAERLETIRFEQERDIVILYFGDLDPSGDSMDGDIQYKLKRFGLKDFEFIRVGVKPEQVEEYDLPEDPDEDTAKRLEENDTRTRGFITKYGKLYAIELDALAGKEPERFYQLVQDAVDEHFDENIWMQVQEEHQEKKVKRKLRKQVKEEILPFLDKTKQKMDDDGA